MRSPILLAALVLAAPARAADKPTGHAADNRSVCMEDVVDDERLIQQGFLWMDEPAAARLTGRLAAHLVCSAEDARAKDPCSALDRMQPAYQYKKEIGTLKARCAFLRGYADFWWESMTAGKKQRRFPACEAHLATLRHPVQFFDLKAKAPRSADADPSNDGGFWNVCKVISERMQKGRSDICEPRVEHYLTPQVPRELWKSYCDAVANLWVRGDEQFCELQKPSDAYCRAAAQMTRAFRRGSQGECPPDGVERGLCLQKLSTKSSRGCAAAWSELQGDFCAERARYSPEELPKPREGTRGAAAGAKLKKGGKKD